MNIEKWIESHADLAGNVAADEYDIAVVRLFHLRNLLKTHMLVPKIPPADTAKLQLPDMWSLWRHRNGRAYRVTGIANANSINPDAYPVSVVYEGSNGKVWCRPLRDWHRSMTLIEEPRYD